MLRRMSTDGSAIPVYKNRSDCFDRLVIRGHGYSFTVIVISPMAVKGNAMEALTVLKEEFRYEVCVASLSKAG